MSGQHAVQRCAERVDIRAVVSFANGLFGSGVLGGADEAASRSKPCPAFLARDAEVRHLHPPVFGQKNVVRFYVPMDHTAGGRFFERPRHIYRNPERADRLHRALLEFLANGGSLNELHDQEVRPIGHPEIEEPHRIRRPEQRCNVGLAFEPVAERGILRSKPRMQELDRHASAIAAVDRFVDGAHTTAAELSHEAVLLYLRQEPGVRWIRHLPTNDMARLSY